MRFLPPRPSLPSGFLYGSKKLVSEKFWLQRTAVKFSANIIWLLVYLFAGSPCLRVFLKRRQPRSVGVRGRETSAFEMVLSPEAPQDKFMAALRWSSSPRGQLIRKFICIAKNLSFPRSTFITAKPIIFSHPPPLSLMHSFAVLKSKWDRENFWLKRIAAGFSANIIWLLVYLFVGSPRLRGVEGAAPYNGTGFRCFPSIHKLNKLFL